MGFCLSVTGPCRECTDAEIRVVKTLLWAGPEITVPIYKVYCRNERSCGRTRGEALRPLSREEDEE